MSPVRMRTAYFAFVSTSLLGERCLKGVAHTFLNDLYEISVTVEARSNAWTDLR